MLHYKEAFYSMLYIMDWMNLRFPPIKVHTILVPCYIPGGASWTINEVITDQNFTVKGYLLQHRPLTRAGREKGLKFGVFGKKGYLFKNGCQCFGFGIWKIKVQHLLTLLLTSLSWYFCSTQDWLILFPLVAYFQSWYLVSYQKKINSRRL